MSRQKDFFMREMSIINKSMSVEFVMSMGREVKKNDPSPDNVEFIQTVARSESLEFPVNIVGSYETPQR